MLRIQKFRGEIRTVRQMLFLGAEKPEVYSRSPKLLKLLTYSNIYLLRMTL